MELIINQELKELIPKLQQEEYQLLEKSIIEEGCRDSIIVWDNTIIDGHNRYEICTRNNIPFKTQEMDFDNIEDVKEWMINNQDAWDSRKLTVNFFSIKDEWFKAKVEKDKKKSIKKGEAYTVEEDKAIVYMYRHNYSASEIGKHIGRDKKSIINRLEKINYGIGVY